MVPDQIEVSGPVFVSICLKVHDGGPPQWHADSIGNFQNSSMLARKQAQKIARKTGLPSGFISVPYPEMPGAMSTVSLQGGLAFQPGSVSFRGPLIQAHVETACDPQDQQCTVALPRFIGPKFGPN